MATERPRADVVIVGFGWAGSVMAEELTRAGLNVVAIERGAWRDTSTDYPPAIDADELRWHTRREMLQAMGTGVTTYRHRSSQTAAPVRDWSAFTIGDNVGGAGTHWAGMSWRFTPWDFQVATRTRERYGAAYLRDMPIHDWGVTYEEMEPYYDRFERIAGTSGKAGNIGGKIQPGGNPFEGPRRRDYPTPALKDTHWMRTYRETTTQMGYSPFPIPAGNLSQAYVNPLGVTMGPCTYCGFCDFHGCGNFSKSSPQACVIPAVMRRPNFTLLTDTEVLHAVKHEDGKTVKGVQFITKDGVEGFQPADIVVFTAFQMDNVRLMLHSGIGEPYDPATGQGTTGKNYNYQTCSLVSGFLNGQKMNPFIGGGALGIQIDEFNGDNFDHSDLGFIGGAGIMAFSTDGRPIAKMNGLRPGTKRWGSEWKEGYARDYQSAVSIFCQGTSMPSRDAYMTLDPTYKDKHGRPMLRVTFDYNENDMAMARYVTDKAVGIMKEAGGQHIAVENNADSSWNPYKQLSGHIIGGAVMGMDPTTSAVNPYLQHWDVHNLFVVGSSAFPNNGGYNPTVTVGALAVRTAQIIHKTYVNNPGALVEG
jgi:gluconate 2-dehydrogenase alpha chain